MAAASATQAGPSASVEAQIRLHTILRFAVGTAAAFVVSEAIGWYPTFLAPLLAGVLLANLPACPPLKVGIVLVIVQAVGAYGAYILTSLLHLTPFVLFGFVAIILLVCFYNLARARLLGPILFVLISFSTIPIVTMTMPQQAGPLPLAFTRAMIVAVVIVWLVYALWPKQAVPKPRSAMTAYDYPLAIALTGVAIVLPLMLLYLMYGITDALPVLITTVVLVINFDPTRGVAQARAMMIGNFIGGAIALLCAAVVASAPSLATLTLVTLLVALAFAVLVERGGPAGAVGLITFNQAIVLFSLALAPGGGGGGLWVTRVTQFGIACLFAVGMMALVFPRLTSIEPRRS